jgi:hypothetical protein
MNKCEACEKNYIPVRNIAGTNVFSYCSEACRQTLYRRKKQRKEILEGKHPKMTINQIEKLGFKFIIWEDAYNV